MKRFLQRAYHLLERIVRESKAFPSRYKVFGRRVAKESFIDGLIPPGKSERYINTVQDYVDTYLGNLLESYVEKSTEPIEQVRDNDKIPVWCCWWQGVESMPELVKMCHIRLKQVIPSDKAELHLITLDNYKSYVDIPEHILEKFDKGIITMTTMSDVLRFHLLERYGGYWLDSTVFFTDDIPEEYFSGSFYCQRMTESEQAKREACKCNWCGFSMAGPKGNIVFRYMKEAFAKWWGDYDTIIDYVLIDYLLMSGYQYVPEIRKIVNQVPNNNEDIFEMYQVLNKPYSKELYDKLTKRNVMHKLTYKMDLQKITEDGQITLYGFLLNMVYGAEDK